MRDRSRYAPAGRGRCSGYRSERGQSLVVAVIVLFVLLFVGGVFIGLVARNLLNSGRSRDTVQATALAEAGLRFAADMLETSPDGADWRPAPTTYTNPNDPDRLWLQTGEYTRVKLSNGRALVKVTMSPDPRNPVGKYIRIESIGRPGYLDETDPTTFRNTPAPRLNRKLVGYKAIGLTDYLRYVTNMDQDSKAEAVFGVPPIGTPAWMQLGGMPVRPIGTPLSGSYLAPGAPIRVNGNARFLNNLTLGINPLGNESVMISGDVKVDGGVSGDATRQPACFNNLQANAANADPSTLPIIRSSTDSAFTTFSGLFRDRSSAPDAQGYARSIAALPPPSIDTADPSTGITRYRQLTRESGLWIHRTSDGRYVNTGRSGFGGGIYISNIGSVERETQSVQGGQSLRSIWLRPGSSPFWNGPHYIPPGVYVDFGYFTTQDRDSSGAPIAGQYVPRAGMRIIRDAADNPWVDPNGVLTTREQLFTFFIYKPAGQRPVLKLENSLFRTFLENDQGMSHQAADAAMPAFNGVIFAEGNVRVRGILPCLANLPIRRQSGDGDGLSDAAILDSVNPPAITVVSGATIYIEGNLVRERATAEDRSLGSMLALLAHDYVAVNTTMFMAPNKSMAYASSGLNEAEPYHTNITTSESAQTPPFQYEFAFGEDPTRYTAQSAGDSGIYYMTRHGVAPGVTYLSLMINEALGTGSGSPLYQFNSAGFPPYVYPMVNGQAGGDLFEQRGFSLDTTGASYPLSFYPGQMNTIRPFVNTSFMQTSGVQDYMLARAAVVPMDIRIEALIYAQSGSFFVIPGYPLNTDPSDTPEAAVRRLQTAGGSPGSMMRPTGTSDLYPFYSQPSDIRITVVGAIAEDQTASVSDQAAWMQLWGYIPDVYGSTGSSPTSTTASHIPQEHLYGSEVGSGGSDYRTAGEKAAGIGRGIRFLYDPALAAPYYRYNVDGWRTPATVMAGGWRHAMGGALRQDNYGRVLPPLPRLPVCPGFVFQGEER